MWFAPCMSTISAEHIKIQFKVSTKPYRVITMISEMITRFRVRENDKITAIERQPWRELREDVWIACYLA